jgi:c-di-GMP-binding flagellar brake protein YcgR
MMRDPFLPGQIVEIAVGDRADSGLYRAQITQADERTLILHVPGFDPLGFVDLLKGTGLTLRASWRGQPHVGISKLTEHFKDSSPYLVVRRPANLVPVRRKACARVSVELDAKYALKAQSRIRPAEPESAPGLGWLTLRGVPEPMDPGTRLQLVVEDLEGAPLELPGSVRRVSRDPEEASSYVVDFAVEKLDPREEHRLLCALLRPPEGEESGRPNGVGQ